MGVYGTDNDPSIDPDERGVLKSKVISASTLVGTASDADPMMMQQKYDEWLESMKSMEPQIVGIFITKIVRYNVLPLLLMLALMLTFMVAWAIVGKTLVPIIERILKTVLRILLCGQCGTGETSQPDLLDNGDNELVPPYAGIYAKKMKIKRGKFEELTNKEHKEGWFVNEMADLAGEPIAVKQRRYIETTTTQGKQRTRGSVMLTWEAMETVPNPYRIRGNRLYRMALSELDDQLAANGRRSESVVERLDNSTSAVASKDLGSTTKVTESQAAEPAVAAPAEGDADGFAS